MAGESVRGGSEQARVARVNAGLFDMLHDAGDVDVGAVRQAVDVDFDGVGEIAVEQERVLAEQGVDLAGLVVRIALLDVFRHQLGDRVEQIGLQHAFRMDDLHGAAAENVGRAHDQREADLGGDEARLLDRIGDAVVRLVEVELHEKLLETVAIFGKVDRIRRRAEDRDAVLFEGFRELQRRLAAELDDDADQLAVFLFRLQDLDHVFSGQRLEIKPVRGVVVGRDGFRVAVDHDRFIAGILQREGRVAAAIVELDALADTVRTAAEDDDLFAVGNLRFGAGGTDEGRLIGRIHIGGGRRELGGAGVDALEDRADVQPVAQFRNFLRTLAGQRREARIRKAHGLQHAQVGGIFRQAVFADAGFHVDDVLQLRDKPGIDLAAFMYFFRRHAEAQSLSHHAQTIRRRACRWRRGWHSGCLRLLQCRGFRSRRDR